MVSNSSSVVITLLRISLPAVTSVSTATNMSECDIVISVDVIFQNCMFMLKLSFSHAVNGLRLCDGGEFEIRQFKFSTNVS